MFPVIEKEVKKLLDAKIIVPLRYSTWVANMVPVKKKNGEIKLCFCELLKLQESEMKVKCGSKSCLSLLIPRGTFYLVLLLTRVKEY